MLNKMITYLLICKNKIKIYDVEKLKQPTISDLYNLVLKNRFQAPADLNDPEYIIECDEQEHVEQKWEIFKSTINEVAEKVVGYRRGTRKERWIAEDT
jgi:hypothetical protein